MFGERVDIWDVEFSISLWIFNDDADDDGGGGGDDDDIFPIYQETVDGSSKSPEDTELHQSGVGMCIERGAPQMVGGPG